MSAIIVYYRCYHTAKPYNYLLVDVVNLQQAALALPPTWLIQKPPLFNLRSPISPLPEHRLQLHIPTALLHHKSVIFTKRTLPIHDMEEVTKGNNKIVNLFVKYKNKLTYLIECYVFGKISWVFAKVFQW